VVAFALTAFSALFSIVDPFGAVPLFISMTAKDSPAERRRTALRASLTMVLALSLFAAVGAQILRFFGISIGALRIAGGILLLLLAIDMLGARPSRQRTTPEETQAGIDKPDVSLFPLGIPMLAGPGAFAAAMVLMSQAGTLPRQIVVFAAILANGVLALVVLSGAGWAQRRLGKTGISVLERVMGLLLAAIAVQFVIDGLRDVLPHLLGRE
jgi:multiple antibiotic resistance protein